MLNRQKIAKEENIDLIIRMNKGLQPLDRNVRETPVPTLQPLARNEYGWIAQVNGLKPIVHGSVSLSQEEVC